MQIMGLNNGRSFLPLPVFGPRQVSIDERLVKKGWRTLVLASRAALEDKLDQRFNKTLEM